MSSGAVNSHQSSTRPKTGMSCVWSSLQLFVKYVLLIMAVSVMSADGSATRVWGSNVGQKMGMCGQHEGGEVGWDILFCHIHLYIYISMYIPPPPHITITTHPLIYLCPSVYIFMYIPPPIHITITASTPTLWYIYMSHASLCINVYIYIYLFRVTIITRITTLSYNILNLDIMQGRFRLCNWLSTPLPSFKVLRHMYLFIYILCMHPTFLHTPIITRITTAPRPSLLPFHFPGQDFAWMENFLFPSPTGLHNFHVSSKDWGWDTHSHFMVSSMTGTLCLDPDDLRSRLHHSRDRERLLENLASHNLCLLTGTSTHGHSFWQAVVSQLERLSLPRKTTRGLRRDVTTFIKKNAGAKVFWLKQNTVKLVVGNLYKQTHEHQHDKDVLGSSVDQVSRSGTCATKAGGKWRHLGYFHWPLLPTWINFNPSMDK